MNRAQALGSVIAVFALTLAACSSAQQDGALRTIAVEGAPKAVGPYAQGIVANGLLYTAGQTASQVISLAATSSFRRTGYSITWRPS